MRRFVIASNNPKKREELQRILSSLGITVVTAREEGFEPEEPEENGSDFIENARIKAGYFMRLTGLPAIADDSGLCVDALGGAPGVYSARYAGEDGNSGKNIDKLLAALSDVPEEQRTARFVCTLCVMFPDGETVEARGECEGFIGFERRGTGGFGYDPVFLLPDGRCFGEMSSADKDAVSHRGRALEQLADLLKDKLA